MALSRQDVLLGRALLTWNLVEQRWIHSCAEDVDRLQKQGRESDLGQLLVARGFLSPDHYQAIVARLRTVYQNDPNAPAELRQATQQLPNMSESGRYTQTFRRPQISEESGVQRAVDGWQAQANQVAAAGSEIELDFDPTTRHLPAGPGGPMGGRPMGGQPMGGGPMGGGPMGGGPMGGQPMGGQPMGGQPMGAPQGAPRGAFGRSSGPKRPLPKGPDAPIRRKIGVYEGPFDVGNWRVQEFVAAGNWGIVYRVTHRNGDATPYALKILKAMDPSEEVKQRFIREARTMAKLKHSGIVHVHDAGTVQGMLWFVMDFLEGPNLKEVVEDKGSLGVAESLKVMRRLCSAVDYAHQQGFLHRDLKPENVVMVDGKPVLTDFGLAKDNESTLNLTQEGQRIGTPLYMAPEILREGAEASASTEVYSLGAMLYECLTGKVPFQTKSILDLLDAIEAGKFDPIKSVCADVPRSLEKLVQRALSTDVKKRPKTVKELVTELIRIN